MRLVSSGSEISTSSFKKSRSLETGSPEFGEFDCLVGRSFKMRSWSKTRNDSGVYTFLEL